MKHSRFAMVVATTAVLVIGTAVGIHAVTATHPVKLCKNRTTGVVTATKSNGLCRSGSASFVVGSNADVRALATRLTKAEARVTALEALTGPAVKIVATASGSTDWDYEVIANNLKPSSFVVIHYTSGGSDLTFGAGGAVTPGGGFYYRNSLPCDFTKVYATATGAGDVAVSSNLVVKGPGCA